MRIYKKITIDLPLPRKPHQTKRTPSFCLTMSTSNATPPDQTFFLSDLLSGKTQGVKNIEAAYN
jgi:hypothetical protein